jgi:NAD(P)H-dependent FMN reductase
MVHTYEQSRHNPPTILVIMGSIRAVRRCPQIADWVIDIAQKSSSLKYELIDLAHWPLPMDDEPAIPETGSYTNSHTLAWSAKVAAADAFVFVTPQYNWGYPAALKNAIDHLYKEWQDKPAVIVTYGGHGGGKCAAQLKQVAEAVEMRPMPTMPGIKLSREAIVGGPVHPETDFQEAAGLIRQAIGELSAALERKHSFPSAL